MTQVLARGCGRFVLYASAAPVACWLCGQEIDFEYGEGGKLVIELPRSHLRHQVPMCYVLLNQEGCDGGVLSPTPLYR